MADKESAMQRWIRFLHGYLYVTVSGYAPERFLNLCNHKKLVIWDLRVTSDGYQFCIGRRSFRALKPLLKKTGTRVKILRKTGLPFLAFRYRKHRCFLFGIGGAVAVLFLLSGFIWSIRIQGNSYYSDQVLEQFLVQSGYGYGTVKYRMDCKKIQNLLRREFDDITWVSARISGSRLYIDIQERLEEENAEKKEQSPKDLVADYAGTVLSITTRSGTPVVKAGDSVAVGDLLVSGLVQRTDDSGTVTGYLSVQADADVRIRTKVPYRDTFSALETTYVRTGEQRKSINLEIAGHQICLGWKIPQKGNWMVSRIRYPADFGYSKLSPVRITFQVSEAYQKESRRLSEQQIRKKAEDRLNDTCKKLKEKGVQILENDVMIKKKKSEILVEGTLDAEAKAAQYRKSEYPDIKEGTKQEWN